jgi:two-component system, OmpR family, phosphate regulon sensor histidine kinase PhoR
VGDRRPARVPAEPSAARRDRESHHAGLCEAESRLVARLRAIGQGAPDFFATVSHELRTPLTSIAGYVEMLGEEQAGPLTPAQAAMLEAAGRNTTRLRQVVEDLLTALQIESGTFRTTRQPVNLVEVAAAAIEALRPAAAALGIALRLDSPRTSATVAGDPGQLGRLVMTLLSHAVRFSPAARRITVGTGASDGLATLTVRDTGTGIPAGQQPVPGTGAIQATAGRPVPGTELGLAVARVIVANHGGELAVHSQEGRGTMVTVCIPLLAASAAGETARTGGQSPPGSPPAGGGPPGARPGQGTG